jgi:type II secretory pathway predicted ATPase ExeA
MKGETISSDELVEICGGSGSGKTYLCLKMASLALLEKETAVIYIDTSNYVNQDNMNLVLSNFIQSSDPREKAEMAQQALGRLRVIKVFDLE